MDRESKLVREMQDQLRRMKDRRKQLERGEIDHSYEPILPHINEIMRDGQLGHVRQLVQQSMEAIDRDIQESVRRLRTAVVPDVIPQSCSRSRDRLRDRSREALLASVKEKLTQRMQRHSPQNSPRVGLRQFRYSPHLEMARLPSVTIATGTQQQPEMKDIRNISIQTDLAEPIIDSVEKRPEHPPSLTSMGSPVTDSSIFLPGAAVDILPEDVIRVVSDILHHEIDVALETFQPDQQQNSERVAEESQEEPQGRLAIDNYTQTIQDVTSRKDAATITDSEAAIRKQTPTTHPEYFGVIQTDAATCTEYQSWRDRSFCEAATSPPQFLPPPSDTPEGLDSADEGSLTPPRLPLAIDPLDASDLDVLRRFSIRLSLSSLPDPLPVVVHSPPQDCGVDASASCPVQDSSSSTTASSSLIQTSSTFSAEGDIELSEGEVLLRVASPGQIDSRDPTATYRNLTRPMDEVIVQDRSSPEPSSYGQIHFPFDGAGSDLGAGIDRDTTGSSSTSTSSSFQSLPVEFSSGQIATNDWSASSVVDEDQQFQTFDS